MIYLIGNTYNDCRLHSELNDLKWAEEPRNVRWLVTMSDIRGCMLDKDTDKFIDATRYPTNMRTEIVDYIRAKCPGVEIKTPEFS